MTDNTTIDSDSLLKTVSEQEKELTTLREELGKVKTEKKRAYAEKLSKATGKQIEEYLKYDEAVLIEMSNLVKEESPKQKGVVEAQTTPPVKKQERFDVNYYKETGNLGYTTEAWNKFMLELKEEFTPKYKPGML